jgi:hypothetical protein
VIAAGSTRSRLVFLLGALIALLAGQQFLAVSGTGRLSNGLQNAAHGPWFALVTWLLLQFTSRRTRGWRTVIATAMICASLAMMTEAMQRYTGGDPSWGDISYDLIGATAALLAWCGHRQLLARRSSYGAAILLLMVTPTPFLQALATESRRVAIAPELVRFDSPLDGALISANSPTKVVAAPDGWAVAPEVLKISLADEMWPGIHLDEPIADWRPYTALAVDVYVEGTQSLPVHISVRLDNAPVAHVYRTFDCAAGPCSMLLPLAGLFDRDTARVNAVVIYSTRDFAGRTIYLGRVALLNPK